MIIKYNNNILIIIKYNSNTVMMIKYDQAIAALQVCIVRDTLQSQSDCRPPSYPAPTPSHSPTTMPAGEMHRPPAWTDTQCTRSAIPQGQFKEQAKAEGRSGGCWAPVALSVGGRRAQSRGKQARWLARLVTGAERLCQHGSRKSLGKQGVPSSLCASGKIRV